MALIDGLQRYYPLDGNGNDVHGGVHGVISGPSPAFQAGHISALAMNLGADVTNVFRATAFGGGDFSVSFWIYRISLAAYVSVVGNMTDPGAVTSDWDLLGSASVGHGVNLYQNANSATSLNSATFPINTWSHVVVTRSGTTATLYVDGSSVATGACSVTAPSGSFFIASRPDGYGPSLSDIRIQEVGLWNRELSGAEITALYNGGTGLSYAQIASGPPVVDTVSPGSGTVFGGTAIAITGSAFTTVTGVEIGGFACSNVVVVDAEHITCDSPPLAPGLHDILVLSPAGDATVPNGWEATVNARGANFNSGFN